MGWTGANEGPNNATRARSAGCGLFVARRGETDSCAAGAEEASEGRDTPLAPEREFLKLFRVSLGRGDDACGKPADVLSDLHAL